MSYKIAIIGGGSSIFTPQVISLVVKSELLRGSTVSLMDINQRRLELMNQLCKKLVEKTGADIRIECTTTRLEALTNADFVITSISVGGFDAWETDLEIPARYGLFVPFGDSIGPGGMMRAFRHVLPLVSMCKDLERVSPHAWVFNYTNPAAVLGLAMGRNSAVRVVSLCTNTVYLRNERHMADLAGVKIHELCLPPVAAGINHCAGLVNLRLKDGRDAFPMVLQRTNDPIVRWGMEEYGILPYAPVHWIEFFPPFCRLKSRYRGKVQGLMMEHGVTVKDMVHEKQRVSSWEDLVGQWARGEGEVAIESIPATEPVQVIEIIESLIADREELHVVNLVNRGAIENLPDDAMVEISAVVGGYGIRAVQAGRIPEGIALVLRQHVAAQELTLEAALTGNRKIALQAFDADPLVSARLSFPEASKLLDELLLAQKEYLPQF